MAHVILLAGWVERLQGEGDAGAPALRAERDATYPPPRG